MGSASCLFSFKLSLYVLLAPSSTAHNNRIDFNLNRMFVDDLLDIIILGKRPVSGSVSGDDGFWFFWFQPRGTVLTCGFIANMRSDVSHLRLLTVLSDFWDRHERGVGKARTEN
ncbi:hypothetical protein DFS34DRAFT_482846 [Phlyctochytrium arcticum]|nr:hypothetical protein DFS34DRAFT_482846 [Phlyctochytrium arcticum]